MATREERLATLRAELRQQSDLGGAMRLLQWDQETYLPPGGAESRARQIGAMAEVLHARQTDPAFLDTLDGLWAERDALDDDGRVDVSETRWRVDRKRALDTALVRERAELHARARARWIDARESDDFPSLAPDLDAIAALERRVAAAIDADRGAYEVLLEGYEPGARLAELTALFDALRAGLRPLVARVRERVSAGRVPPSPLLGTFDLAAQQRFNTEIARTIGFDFELGRLDEAAHPFTMTVGDDVRLTTRYDTANLGYSLYSTLHEAGHGLYEQGLDPAARGLPCGTACSLGVHESQSRLWENTVGRSEGFWRHALPAARRAFPSLEATDVDALVLGANEAAPSLIRTEADEITYDLHVALRFELERRWVADELRAADLPAAWREQMRDDLGVVPPDDRQGVLQDVHWSAGAIGYFPTYTLGNVFAAQLAEAAAADLGPLEPAFAAGEFAPLLRWLRERVHRPGQRLRSRALIEAATGRPPKPDALLRRLASRVERLEAAG